jgi:2-oxoglutarate ferredoxin oxidoreductase subunit alpha
MNTTQPRLFRTGSQMIADGAIRAGCRFFAGYPITPASGIYKRMIEALQQRGDLAMSSPDEISALAYCVGASMRGFKAMTATSGPGWALMIETVQYALMTETPVVIAMVQRLGPSTGGATQGAQGDILLTEFCTSGGYTIPVLCPSTAKECFELSVVAFNWSERLRTPVVLLADKEVAMTSETVDPSTFRIPQIDEREHISEADFSTWRTYDFAEIEDVPAFSPVGGRLKVMATGSAHNKTGALKKNDPETLEILLHLEEKIRSRRGELELGEPDVEEGADTLVLSFGVTARAMRQAVRQARQRGRKVSGLNVFSLFPIPERLIRESAAGVRRVVVAEENLTGQYRTLITPLLRNAEVVGINRIGRMITPAEIEDVIL